MEKYLHRMRSQLVWSKEKEPYRCHVILGLSVVLYERSKEFSRCCCCLGVWGTGHNNMGHNNMGVLDYICDERILL